MIYHMAFVDPPDHRTEVHERLTQTGERVPTAITPNRPRGVAASGVFEAQNPRPGYMIRSEVIGECRRRPSPVRRAVSGMEVA